MSSSNMMIMNSIIYLLLLALTIRCQATKDEQGDDKKEKEEGGGDSMKAIALNCQAYVIEMIDEDRSLVGVNPEDTEVYEEARRNGLVPILTYTIFATPKAINLNQLLPGNLTALSQTLLSNMGNMEDSGTNGPTFTFIGGVIAKTMDKDSSGQKDENNNEKENGKENGKEEEKAPGGGEGGSKKSNKKGSKLVQNMPSLREGLAVNDKDEASETFLMPREE